MMFQLGDEKNDDIGYNRFNIVPDSDRLACRQTEFPHRYRASYADS